MELDFMYLTNGMKKDIQRHRIANEDRWQQKLLLSFS